jgi:hypothetical protein
VTQAVSTARSVCREAVGVFAAAGVVGGRAAGVAFLLLLLLLLVIVISSHPLAAAVVARRLLLARGQARGQCADVKPERAAGRGGHSRESGRCRLRWTVCRVVRAVGCAVHRVSARATASVAVVAVIAVVGTVYRVSHRRGLREQLPR